MFYTYTFYLQFRRYILLFCIHFNQIVRFINKMKNGYFIKGFTWREIIFINVKVAVDSFVKFNNVWFNSQNIFLIFISNMSCD